MPRVPGGASNGRKPRHTPLVEEYAPSGPVKQKAGKKRKAGDTDDADPTVDSRASRQILRIGQDLVNEADAEEEKSRPNPAFAFESREDDGVSDEAFAGDDDEEAWGDEDDEGVVDVCSRSPTASRDQRLTRQNRMSIPVTRTSSIASIL